MAMRAGRAALVILAVGLVAGCGGAGVAGEAPPVVVAPVAAFDVTPTSPVVGQAVQFSDGSTGAPTSWAWSFGDGAASTERSPSHAFAAAGSYAVTLTAANAGGATTASHTVVVAAPSPLPSVPGAPSGLVAAAGDAAASLAWLAPADDGGSPITGYTVLITPDAPGAAFQVSGTAATVTGLANGAVYVFQVLASNAVGDGPPSAPSLAVSPLTVPGAPLEVSATAGVRSAALTWSAPASDGGRAVTGYTVRVAPATPAAAVAVSGTSATVTGLADGATYAFAVSAVNAAGTGPESAPSSAVTTPTAPGVPTGLAAVAGDAAAGLSWLAPASDGGRPITGYTVLVTPAAPGATVQVSGTTATVTGLANGTGYAFRVVASNAVGDGPASAASATVTPAAPIPPPVATVTAPAAVTGGQGGYAASVPLQAGASYAWTVVNGTLLLGQGTDAIAFRAGDTGTVVLSCAVTGPGGTATGSALAAITPATPPPFNLAQALQDGAQSTTLAFSGFGMVTGNLGAQSFFPPGKVADYWGFQFLRDNDPDGMGHNTSFLTRVSSNVLFILDDAQLARLKALAASQVASINEYGWRRYPLMAAFRRLLDRTGPAGNTGLSLDAVRAASRELYLLDGRISLERAVAYGEIYRSLTAAQKAWLGDMAGKGFNAWPPKAEADVRDKTRGLTNDEVVAVMTYAGDLYAWYAGSITADVYFCPERHGTYFGSFYIKDAPAVGHPGYSIDEQLTATVGRALVDERLGYVSAGGAARMRALATAQAPALSTDPDASIVLARTRISEALRGLIRSTPPSQAELDAIRATVDQWSAIYGELDGANNHLYATTYHEVFNNVGGAWITDAQKARLQALRQQVMTVTYADGTTIDFSVTAKHFLYAAEIPAGSADLLGWSGDAATDPLFTGP